MSGSESELSDSNSHGRGKFTQKFLIVQFEDGVQLVHLNWMKGNSQCCWPPSFHSSARYDKAVKTGEEPDSTWKCFPVKVLRRFSTWDEARLKLKTAEEKSDLNTTDVEDKYTRKIRKRNNPSDSEESSVEAYDNLFRKLPQAPKPPCAAKKMKKTTYTNNYKEKEPTLPCMTSPVTQSHSWTFSNDSTPPASTSSSFRAPTFDQGSNEDKEWRMKVQRDLSEIKLNIKRILYKLNQTETAQPVRPLTEIPSANNVLESEVWACIPMRNEGGLSAVEKKILDSEEFKSKMISVLARSGGNNTKEIVKSILKKIMADELGLMFSWLGGKGKKVLSTSPLVDVIFGAVRENKRTKDATDVDIISDVKNWLRHAPQRAKSKMAVRNDAPEEEARIPNNENNEEA